MKIIHKLCKGSNIMLQSLILKLAKKYIIDSINELLSKNKDNMRLICDTIAIWIIRLEKILAALKHINERASDAKLDDEEVKDSVKDLESIIKEW